jgi:hypothetical protein
MLISINGPALKLHQTGSLKPNPHWIILLPEEMANFKNSELANMYNLSKKQYLCTLSMFN